MSRSILLFDLNPGLLIKGNPSTGVIGSAYSFAFVGYGGTAPYTWALIGSPQAGLSFSNGVISGTPSVVGDVSLTIELSDSARSQPVRKDFVLSVIALPLTISGHVPDGTTGDPASFSYSIAGGVAPYTVTVNSGTSPFTGDFDNTGAGVGTRVGGFHSWNVHVVDSNMPPAVVDLPDSCTNSYATLTFTGTPPQGTVGVPYTFTPVIAGGSGSNTVTVTVGSIPSWASLNSSTGVITGTPTTNATTTFTLHCHSSDGQNADLPCSLTVVLYATWNPSDKATQIDLDSTHLIATNNASGPDGIVRANQSVDPTQSTYWEYSGISSGAEAVAAGLADLAANLGAPGNAQYLGIDTDSVGGYWTDGKWYFNSSVTPILSPGALTSGQTIGVWLNAGVLKVNNGTGGGSGVWQTVMSGITGTWYPAASVGNHAGAPSITANFGASAFTGAWGVPGGARAGVFQ